LTTFPSVLCQSPCNRKADKNGFALSEIDIFCDFAKTGQTRPKLVGNLINNFDVQSLGSDSNSWVLPFRDRFGMVRSLVISNLEKGRKLLSIPRKIFGNFEEVIGDSSWNSKLVKDSIEKLLHKPKKADFDARPPSTFSLTDIFRTVSTIWKPKQYVVQELKKSVDNSAIYKKRISENEENFSKSTKFFGMPKQSNENLDKKVFDPKYLEIISKINQMSKAMKNAEKILDTQTQNSDPKIDESIKGNKNLSKISSTKVNGNKKFAPKQKQTETQSTKKKSIIKSPKIKPEYFKSGLTEIISSEADLVLNPSFKAQFQPSPPLKRVPLSATIITGKSKIWPNKLIVPKIAPPTPLISPTSVLSPPIDFAQTILPEPTSDIDTFTYRDAVIAEDSQQFMPNDKELKVFTQFQIDN